MRWTDKDMIRFARIASEGAYGLYSRCKSLESKLSRYKKLSKTMSRYIKELENGKTVAYGYDHVAGYFFDVFDVPDDDGVEHLLIEESSILTKMSNGKMLELMHVYELPESHIEQVAMDLPIK